MEDKVCGNCQKQAVFVCMRCNVECYCSKKCQTAAFAQHRRECFSLPHLKLISNEQPVLGSSQNSSNGIDETDKNKVQLKPEIEQQKEVDLPVKTSYEKKESPPKAETPKIEQKELVTPAFNQGVRTVAPNDYKKTPSVMSLNKSTGEPEKVVTEAKVPEKKAYPFENMRRNQQAPLMPQPKMKPKEPKVFFKDLKFRKLAPGKVKIKIVSGDDVSKVFQAVEAIPAVEEYMAHLEANINEFVANDKTTSYTPEKDEVILAKFEGVYYRAIVEEIGINESKQTAYGVSFIDYGNYAHVTENDIKPFVVKLKSEVVLFTVLLQNFPDIMSDKQAAILSNEDGFDINIKEQAKNHYIADVVGI